MYSESDKEYLILEHINDTSAQTRQRDLAAAADLSLGMTNAVLKKLVTKGLLVLLLWMITRTIFVEKQSIALNLIEEKS